MFHGHFFLLIVWFLEDLLVNFCWSLFWRFLETWTGMSKIAIQLDCMANTFYHSVKTFQLLTSLSCS